MLRHYSHAGIAISHGKFAGEMEGVALRNIKMDSRCIHAILLRISTILFADRAFLPILQI